MVSSVEVLPVDVECVAGVSPELPPVSCAVDEVRCRCVYLLGNPRLWGAVILSLLGLGVFRLQSAVSVDLQGVLLLLRAEFAYLLGGGRQCGLPFVSMIGVVRCRCVLLLGDLLLGVATLMVLSL